MSFAKEVMDVLASAVERAGSVRKLAQQTGVNQPNLSRWLNGSRDPTLSILGQVMDFLDIHLDTGRHSTETTSCPELEAECARLRRIVSEQEIRLDELRALLRPAGMEESTKKEKAG